MPVKTPLRVQGKHTPKPKHRSAKTAPTPVQWVDVPNVEEPALPTAASIKTHGAGTPSALDLWVEQHQLAHTAQTNPPTLPTVPAPNTPTAPVFAPQRELVGAVPPAKASPMDTAHGPYPTWLVGGVGLGVGMALGGGGGKPTPTTPNTETGMWVQGKVVAGPLLPGHGLEVTAYRADGTVLAQGTVRADGRYSIPVQTPYIGMVIVRVTDQSPGADYFDEASLQPKDMTGDLRAITHISQTGTYDINVNPLTELVARQLGLAGGQEGRSVVQTTVLRLSAEQVAFANRLLAGIFGLNVDLLTDPVVPSVQSDGSSNGTQANPYGWVLAAISGLEQWLNQHTDAVLDLLSPEIMPLAMGFSQKGKMWLLAGARQAHLSPEQEQALVRQLGVSDADALQLKALADLSQYAGATPAPTLSDYLNARVAQVDESNLAAINSAMARASPSQSQTLADIQHLVDAYNAILGLADGQFNRSAESLPVATYSTLGITGVQTERHRVLLHQVLDTRLPAQVDDIAKVQQWADGVGQWLDATAGGPAPGLEMFDAFGLSGVSSEVLPLVQAALAATPDDGSAIADWPRLQNWVASTLATIQTALDRVHAQALSVQAPDARLSDYATLGLGTVTPATLDSLNAAVRALPAQQSASLSALAGLVDAFAAVWQAANGQADGASVALAAYQTLGLDLQTHETQVWSLLNQVLDRSTLAQVTQAGDLPSALALVRALLAPTAPALNATQWGRLGWVTDPDTEQIALDRGLAALGWPERQDLDTVLRTAQQTLTTVRAAWASLRQYGGDGAEQTPPTAQDYQAIGIQGVTSAATTGLLNSLLLHFKTSRPESLTRTDALQTLATLAQQAMAAVQTESAPFFDLAWLQTLGVTGVTAPYLPLVKAAFAQSPDDGSGIATWSALNALVQHTLEQAQTALRVIQAHAGRPETAPGIQDYLNLGIQGVTQEGLNAINSAMANGGGPRDTPPDIQRIVDAYLAVWACADGQAGNGPWPDSTTWALLGISGAETGAATTLLGSVTDGKNHSDIDTVGQLQALADAVVAVLDAARGSPLPQSAPLALLGVQNLRADHWPAIVRAIEQSADDGQDIATLAQLQTLVNRAVDQAQQQLAALSAYNGSGNAPTASDYLLTGVAGVLPENVSAINSVVANLYTGQGQSVTALQQIVNAYVALLDLAQGRGTHAPTLEQYETLGIAGVDAQNLVAIQNAIATHPDQVGHIQTIQALVTEAAQSSLGGVITISAYTGNNTAPQLADFQNAGVLGVDENNLGPINSALALLGPGATNTSGKIQAVVNAYRRVLEAADGQAGNLDRAIGLDEWGLLGLRGLHATALNLLNEVVDQAPANAVAVVGEIQNRLDGVNQVLAWAAEIGPAPTQTLLESLGLTNLNPTRTSWLLEQLAASSDDGSGVQHLAQLQAWVDTGAPGVLPVL